MVTIDNVVGRLVEVRMSTPVLASELASFGTTLPAIVRKLGKIIAITDLRGATVFPAELADQILEMMTKDNPYVEQGALILPEGSATFGLQLDRVLRAANNPRRRGFRSLGEAQRWLAEKLDLAERKRLGEFLDQGAMGVVARQT